MEKIFL